LAREPEHPEVADVERGAGMGSGAHLAPRPFRRAAGGVVVHAKMFARDAEGVVPVPRVDPGDLGGPAQRPLGRHGAEHGERPAQRFPALALGGEPLPLVDAPALGEVAPPEVVVDAGALDAGDLGDALAAPEAGVEPLDGAAGLGGVEGVLDHVRLPYLGVEDAGFAHSTVPMVGSPSSPCAARLACIAVMSAAVASRTRSAAVSIVALRSASSPAWLSMVPACSAMVAAWLSIVACISAVASATASAICSSTDDSSAA